METIKFLGFGVGQDAIERCFAAAKFDPLGVTGFFDYL
jgi:hypothetical protein